MSRVAILTGIVVSALFAAACAEEAGTQAQGLDADKTFHGTQVTCHGEEFTAMLGGEGRLDTSWRTDPAIEFECMTVTGAAPAPSGVDLPDQARELEEFFYLAFDRESLDSGGFIPRYEESLEIPYETSAGASYTVTYTPANEDMHAVRLADLIIDSAPDVVNELRLYEIGGIEAGWGDLYAFPIGDGILYAKPLYAAVGEPDPVLEHVAVQYRGEVAFDAHLNAAFAQLFQ